MWRWKFVSHASPSSAGSDLRVLDVEQVFLALVFEMIDAVSDRSDASIGGLATSEEIQLETVGKASLSAVTTITASSDDVILLSWVPACDAGWAIQLSESRNLTYACTKPCGANFGILKGSQISASSDPPERLIDRLPTTVFVSRSRSIGYTECFLGLRSVTIRPFAINSTYRRSFGRCGCLDELDSAAGGCNAAVS